MSPRTVARRLVYVGVVQTPPDMALEQRLLAVAAGIAELIDEHRPDAMAVERVFAQHNLRTVMGTAQASGIALAPRRERGLPVGLHTPSEVKAAITGYGVRREGAGGGDGRAGARARRGPEARGCRRRAGAGDLPRVEARCADAVSTGTGTLPGAARMAGAQAGTTGRSRPRRSARDAVASEAAARVRRRRPLP